MIEDILFSVWFLLPAAFANVAPIFAAKLPWLRNWNARLDFGKQYRGQDILGEHKTWRGVISGIIVATIVLGLQKLYLSHNGWNEPGSLGVNYATIPVFIFGPLLGVGALGGDALKSFFKRRRQIKAGQKWPPFDQLDYVLGAILITLPFVILPVRIYVLMIGFWFGAHLVASYIGWLLKLKDAPL